MTNTFKAIAYKIQDSYMCIFFFFFGVCMVVVGINHFAEDTISSYYGIKMLETHYGMTPTTYTFTYLTISISAQVAQVVFFYIFVTNPRQNWWALVIFLVASGFDFYTDVWYRSNENVFKDLETALVSGIMTFMIYTFGSELFISTGFGLSMELFAPTIRQIRKVTAEVKSSFGSRSSNSQGQQNTPRQPHNQRRPQGRR